MTVSQEEAQRIIRNAQAQKAADNETAFTAALDFMTTNRGALVYSRNYSTDVVKRLEALVKDGTLKRGGLDPKGHGSKLTTYYMPAE